MSTVMAIIHKDCKLELRTRESLPAMVLFSVSAFVLFHFGLDRNAVHGDLAAGVLLVTLLLAALLGINRLYVSEKEQGGFDAFLLAPVNRTGLILAKGVLLFLYLTVLELLALPAFGVLLLGPSLTQALPQLIGILLLVNFGIATIGTLIGALAVQTRARELIVPLLALPLMIPLVIAAVKTTTPLFLPEGAEALQWRWVGVMALYDMVFALVALGISDFLLED